MTGPATSVYTDLGCSARIRHPSWCITRRVYIDWHHRNLHWPVLGNNAAGKNIFGPSLKFFCLFKYPSLMRPFHFHCDIFYPDLIISFQSIQSVLVTSAFMMVVSFILIPNPVCSLWVAFSIMSIEVCWQNKVCDVGLTKNNKILRIFRNSSNLICCIKPRNSQKYGSAGLQ